MRLLTPQFEGHTVRITGSHEAPWFVAKDICDILGLGNAAQATSRLEDDEKGIIQNDTLGGPQMLLFINESGLYSLLLRSDKPQAKPFRKWVTREILPAVRKTGGY